MSIYNRFILPSLVNIACGSPQIRSQRQWLLPQAYGRVLEVGFGTGLNLPWYNSSQVELLWALEPSEGMRRKSGDILETSPMDCRWLDLEAEQIPLDDNSIDTIVLTYTLCSIHDWKSALQQMRRVLKPGGQLLFSEHGKAPDQSVHRWQNRINPIWNKLAGGCHLNRAIPQLLKESGFSIKEMDSSYLPAAPKMLAFNYRGWAKAN